MTPYFQQDGITLYHGDCREVMPTLGRFDLLLTDPPYGLGMRTVSGGTAANTQVRFIDELAASRWDDETPSDEVFAAMFDSSQSQIVWGGNYFRLPPTRGILVWDKMVFVPTMSRCEIAWTSFDFPCKFIQLSSSQSDRQHPTQKPVALIRWCLSFAPDAKTILDPFAGSGTTLLAAKLEGRQAVGIEISERYCEIAANRLRQKVLF